MVRKTRVGRSPRGRNPSIRVQIPASPCFFWRLTKPRELYLETAHRYSGHGDEVPRLWRLREAREPRAACDGPTSPSEGRLLARTDGRTATGARGEASCGASASDARGKAPDPRDDDRDGGEPRPHHCESVRQHG